MSAEVLSFNYKNVCKASQHTCAQIKALRLESERNNIWPIAKVYVIYVFVYVFLWLPAIDCRLIKCLFSCLWMMHSWESKHELSYGNLIACRSALNNDDGIMMFFLFFISKTIQFRADSASLWLQSSTVFNLFESNRYIKMLS